MVTEEKMDRKYELKEKAEEREKVEVIKRKTQRRKEVKEDRDEEKDVKRKNLEKKV